MSGRIMYIDDATLESIIETEKHIYYGVQMEDSETVSRFTETSVYAVPSGTTMPGVQVMIRSTRTNDFQTHSFSLAHKSLRGTSILLQLEVFPDDVVSHREPGLVIYGPHVHRAGKTERLAGHNWDWQNWLTEFSRRANLEIIGERIPPFNGVLL